MKLYKYHIRLSGKDKETLHALKRTGKTERRIADHARVILWSAVGLAVDEIVRSIPLLSYRRPHGSAGQSYTFMSGDSPPIPVSQRLLCRPASQQQQTFKKIHCTGLLSRVRGVGIHCQRQSHKIALQN